MRHKILLASFVLSLCAAAARTQSGPDNDPDTAPGYVNSVFHHGQVDSINLYNGQLTIPISLGPSYPVGPKLKFQAVLTYNSRKFDYGHPTIQPPDFVYQPFAGNPALGQGWEFTLGAIKLCKQGNTGGVCYFGADGSQHIFNLGSKTGDGSQLYLSGAGPYDMWDGEGNHYVFGWQVTGFDDIASPGYIHDFGAGRDGWYLSSVTDSFGNSYSVGYHTVVPPCWSYGSPTGQCTLTPRMTCPASPVRTWIPQTISLPTGTVQVLLRTQGPTANMIGDFIFPVAAGASAVWSLTYEQVWDNFHDCSSFVVQMPVLVQRITAIVLPPDAGGSPSYSFSNSCPFTMTLPTGASIAYRFGPYTFFHGRAGAVVPNCGGMTPQSVQYAETSFPEPCPQQPGQDPPLPRSAVSATCSVDNDARWMDVASGVLVRTETVPGGETAVTEYTQYSFPYGERGSISAKQDAQTLTVVLLPADADNRRRAKAVLFRSSPVTSGPNATVFNAPGDRVGADLEERVFDANPNTGAAISTSTPACPGTASDQPFCSSKAVRVTQRTFEYDDTVREIGDRRLKVEAVCFGPSVPGGSCQSGLFHTVTFSNPPGVNWDANGRHYNVEEHSGSLGNDDRTVTTTWTPSVSPWLPNLFNRRTETHGASTVDHYFEFTPSNAFFRGDFIHDTDRQIVFLTCRYDDGAGNVGQDFSATYQHWPGWPGPPAVNACSLIYPTYPTTAVGVNGDAFGKTYTHRYGQLLSARWMANPTTPASWFLKNIFRDPATGWITFSVDPAGLGTGYSYDSLGRVTGIFPPADAPTIVSYDSTKQTTATRDGGNGLFTLQRYIYDGLGRTSREIRLMPAGSALPYAVRLTQYDGAAHTSFVSEWAGCSGPLSCADSSPAAGTSSSNFDPLGRPQTIRNADGATTTISYTDSSSQFSDTQKTVTVSNINGVCSGACSGGIFATTTYRYDAFGRLTAVTEPGGADVTSYAYDANGKLTQVSQGVQTRTFSYDAAGFLRSETTPEKGAVSYDTYGSLGNLLSETEPGSLAVSRTYDFGGRLTGVISGGLRYLTNCYDGQACEDGDSGYPGGLHPSGKLTRRIAFNPQSPSIPKVTDDLTFSDAAGRLSSQTTTITGGSNLSTTQRWQFNGLGLIAHHSHPRPDGATPFIVSTDYDAGLPKTQYINGLSMVTGITHRPSGSLASYSTGIGIGHNVTTTIAEDTSSLPRPARISATPEGLTSPAFDTQTYLYDGAGNIVAMGPDTFGYDARSRLTSAALSGFGSQGFGYDKYGNLLSKGGVSYSVSPSTNRILTASYDARGNLTVNGSETYDYDGLDRQIRHTASPSVWNYVFDGADERIVKMPPSGSWTYTLRDESKRIVSEFSGASQSRDNLFLGNLLVASYANGAVGGNDRVWTFYSSDHLATPRLITDLTATTVETPRNWPFGENATSTGLFQRIRFASMERDSEATRYYDHARNHEFTLGRFLSPDKVSGKPTNPQSWDRYAYVHNNPLRYFDPDGQALKLAPLISFDTASEIRQAVRTAIQMQPVGGGELTAAVADFLLSSVLPQDYQEQFANIQNSIVGIGTPVSGPAASLLRKGTSVLGHFPAYIVRAEELGARRFNVPTSIWNKLTAVEKWTANRKFLDRLVMRGDEVVLATPLSKVKPGSTLEREINYLLEKGYTVDKDGLRMHPPN